MSESDGLVLEFSDVMCKFIKNIGRISKCIRKEDDDGMRDLGPIFYGCLMDVWNRLGIDIYEVMWLKYPNVCPYCLRVERCACIITEKSSIYRMDDTRFDCLRNAVQERPASTAEWQMMFKRIYGNINSIKPLTAVWLHFIEEVCELTEELESGNAQGIAEESADVMAWFFSFCTKLNININIEGPK